MTDDKVMALLRVYQAYEDDQYLDEIGRHLWNMLNYSDLMIEACGEEIYSFKQENHWLFSFHTSPSCAALFKTIFPISEMIETERVERTPHSKLIFFTK